MMIGHVTCQIIVKCRNAPVDAADRPVVADEKILEPPSLNRRPLGSSHCRTEILSAVNCVVRPGIIRRAISFYCHCTTSNRTNSQLISRYRIKANLISSYLPVLDFNFCNCFVRQISCINCASSSGQCANIFWCDT